MNKRWIEILNYLRTHKVATSEAMAQALHVSPKTIRNSLKELNSALKNQGAEIHSKQRIGYSLHIEDEKSFNRFLSRLNLERVTQPFTSEERISYLLEQFLVHADEYMKLDDLSEQLYVSKSSISADLKEVRKILERFNLDLVTRPNYGIKVEGKEFDLRLCAASQTIVRLSVADKDDTNEKLRCISQCVSGNLKKSNVRLSDVSYRNLLVHIYIAIHRIQKGHYVPMDSEFLESMIDSEEYQLAHQIVTSLEEMFEVEMPSCEIGYLAIHLSGKQFIEYGSNKENVVISSEINGIVKHMLNEIKNSYNIDFTDDLELTMNLALHLVPMKVRMQYDMNLRNPLLEEIKKRYSLAYMLAVSACGILKKHYQKDVDEDEIAYFALHFNLALERQKSFKGKKNIVAVCATGRGTASLLEYKLKSEFGSYLNRIETCDVTRLEQMDLSSVDYVVTTVPIPFKINKPILEIQFFLDDKDVKALKSLLSGKSAFKYQQYFDPRLFVSHMQAESKEEVIIQMIEKIKEVKELPDDFYDLIMQREQLAVTAFGNLVAIPHPCRTIGKETFVCIAILDKPILWNEVEVQFVFMMSLKENRDENMETFSTMISKLLLNPKYIRALIDKRDYQTLIDCFNEIGEGMENDR